jgi:hypothetical protein
MLSYQWHSVVEVDYFFTLQPVIMEYLTTRIIEQICEEIKSNKIEIFRSHALLKAGAKDYVREAQIRLIFKPAKERLFAIFTNQRSIENQLKQILSTLQ